MSGATAKLTIKFDISANVAYNQN